MKHLSKEEILEEVQLIEQAKKEPKLFGVLYKRYFTEITNFIFSKIREQSTSYDLSQQVFIKALQNIPKYQFKGVPYVALLYRIASNECNSYFRSQKKERGISLDSDACKTIAYEVDLAGTTKLNFPFIKEEETAKTLKGVSIAAHINVDDIDY